MLGRPVAEEEVEDRGGPGGGGRPHLGSSFTAERRVPTSPRANAVAVYVSGATGTAEFVSSVFGFIDHRGGRSP